MEAEGMMTPRLKVAVLWALLLGFFLVFNAVYFPIRSYQAERAPENFESFAERLRDSDRVELAQKELAVGIAWFHPTYPEPYAKLEAAGDVSRSISLALYSRLVNGPLDLAGIEALTALHPPLHGNTPDLSPAILLWREQGYFEPALLPVPQDAAAAIIVGGHGTLSPGVIGGSGVAAPVPLLAASGPRAVLMIDGVDYGGRARGLYAAILDGETGRILQLGQFDLWESWDESLRMAKFLQRAPQRSIGVFAASQEASVYFDYTHLGPEMEYFGLERQAMINGRLRFYGLNYTFAAIGVKGTAGGIQSWSPGEFNGHKGHPSCVAAWPEKPNA